jgi:predicted metal-binding protein
VKKDTVYPKASMQAAIKTIIEQLQDQGASHAKLIDARNIIVDERVRLKCQIPICDSYGKNLMCPPYVPSVSAFREALALYHQAILIQTTATIPQNISLESKDAAYISAKKLHELVHFAEKKAFEHQFRFATGLIGGCCRLCDECVAVRKGRFCRHPFKARPSMEAMGIDVVGTVMNGGLSVVFPISETVTWTGIVLM